MTDGPRIALHHVEHCSRANGPGRRFVVWTQGCSLGCPGCFNPKTHEPAAPGQSVAALVDDIYAAASAHDLDGLTISGGEPMEQAEAVAALVSAVRQRGDLSIVLFSGFTRAEIEARAFGQQVLACLDVLIDGRYEAPARVATELRGSSNQQVHLLSPRYTHDDIAAVPEAEIRIQPDGSVHVTGVGPLRIR